MFRALLFVTAVFAFAALAGEGPDGLSAALAEEAMQGDVNCDATVDGSDWLQILRSDGGLTTEASCLAAAGDVNCDFAVNSMDALQLLRHHAGLVVVQGPGCSEIGSPVGEAPTSEQLIAAALAGGEIDYPTSLLYRAYALYGDEELPNEYGSPVVDLHAGGELFREIAEHEGELEASLLDQLAPFRARPNDPASVFNTATFGTAGVAGPAWESRAAAGGAVRVWVQAGPDADAALDEYAARATEVWDPVTALMRAPIPDKPGDPEVNPDAAIDIYFVRVGDLDPRMRCTSNPAACEFNNRLGGYTAPERPYAGSTASASVLIDRQVQGDTLTSHLIHEIFHTMQFAYDYKEPAWLMDSTATWASFHILWQTGYSREPVHGYLQDFFLALDQPLTRDEGLNRYASWVYFLFAEMERGPDVVKNVWERAAAAGKQNEVAVDLEFPFLDFFHKFALRNWNQEPVSPMYESMDPTFPFVSADVNAVEENVTAGHAAYELGGVVRPLATQYYRYFFQDEGIESVVFNNPIEASNIRVQAMKKVGEEWLPPEDWTANRTVSFCKDLPGGDISEMVIIISNSSLATPFNPPEAPNVEASDAGCNAWVGSASADIEVSGRRFTTEVSGLRFEVDPEAVDPTGRYVFYKLTESPAVTWEASGPDDFGCAVSGEMHVPAADGTIGEGIVYGQLTIDLWEDAYYASVWAFEQDATFTVACPGTDPYELGFGPQKVLNTPVPTARSGQNLAGDYVDDTNIYSTEHWTWLFMPAP